MFNAINVGWTGSGANAGYSNVPHGSSFVMVAQFTGDEDCPVDTRTILTYSQSTNPNSPYFGDQTRMFSNKEWVDEALLRGRDRGRPQPRGDGDLRGDGVPTAQGRLAAERSAGARLRSVHHARSHPRAAARVPLLLVARTSRRGNLTVGTPDANGAVANFSGFVKYVVAAGQPGRAR